MTGGGSLLKGLDKKIEEFANKNGYMYVIDEEPFLINPLDKPIIINYFYHEKINLLRTCARSRPLRDLMSAREPRAGGTGGYSDLHCGSS